MRTGTANLPLHGGHAPPWLFKRMVRLGREITKAIIYEYSVEEFLRRLSDPFWFQAFSCVLGYDWHSSGTTTVTMGALKEALGPELGIVVCGGKGKVSRKTPDEIVKFGDDVGLREKQIERLIYTSKITAKVDNSALQDGYQLYHHTLVFDEKGRWVVIQQGMNDRYARRYHWKWDIEDFVNEPHSGIDAQRIENNVLDMTSSMSKEARKVSVDAVNDFKSLTLPPNHPILKKDLTKRTIETLKKVSEMKPSNYEELLSLKGVGPKSIRALALISEIIYGTPPSWEDPVKFSFAHGGKDGYPYPVRRDIYDKSIEILRDAIERAKTGDKDKLYAIKRLNEFIKV